MKSLHHREASCPTASDTTRHHVPKAHCSFALHRLTLPHLTSFTCMSAHLKPEYVLSCHCAAQNEDETMFLLKVHFLK